MRTHIIGDVHGCYSELCDLLSALAPASDDRLIFVGDLVVRGPDNAGVVRLLMKDGLPNTTILLGNNEEKLRPTLEGSPRYAVPPVLKAIEQLREAGLLDDALAWFETFPLYVDLGAHWIVHAGVRPHLPLDRQTHADLVSIKTIDGSPDGPMWWDHYAGENVVVFGHHVLKDVTFRANSIGLDTGCCYGGRLSALTLDTYEVTSVRAREVYHRIPQKAFLLED
jgi:serine/threonine protein phosphatase 1